MGKVIFTITYDVLPEKRDEYLALSQEMKLYLAGNGRNYSVYEEKGKKNSFAEIFSYNNMEEFDQIEDDDERMQQFVQQLESMLANGKMKYRTLVELQ